VTGTGVTDTIIKGCCILDQESVCFSPASKTNNSDTAGEMVSWFSRFILTTVFLHCGLGRPVLAQEVEVTSPDGRLSFAIEFG
jgi:hypothetical protein